MLYGLFWWLIVIKTKHTMDTNRAHNSCYTPEVITTILLLQMLFTISNHIILQIYR